MPQFAVLPGDLPRYPDSTTVQRAAPDPYDYQAVAISPAVPSPPGSAPLPGSTPGITPESGAPPTISVPVPPVISPPWVPTRNDPNGYRSATGDVTRPLVDLALTIQNQNDAAARNLSGQEARADQQAIQGQTVTTPQAIPISLALLALLALLFLRR